MRNGGGGVERISKDRVVKLQRNNEWERRCK